MASSLIPTATLASIIESERTDEELEYLIDAAEEAIMQIIGGSVSDGSRTHTTRIWPPTPYLWLPHRAASIQSIDMDGEEVDADDYSIEEEGSLVRRTSSPFGAYREGIYSWAGDIDVMYTRVLRPAFWREALIDLVRVSANRMGVRSQGTGPHSVTALESERERAAILGRVKAQEPGGVLVG